MLPPVLYTVLILLQISYLEAKLHYALIFPSTMHSNQPNHLCLHLEDVTEDCNVMISLNIGNKTTPLLTKQFQNSAHWCNTIQIPDEMGIIHHSGTLLLSIQTGEELIHGSRKVNIKKKKKDLEAHILIQTDKPLYKPGETVKFRIVSINGNFQPEITEIPFIELQDPEKNRIGQWMNISLTQGLMDLSYALSLEPQLGLYAIRVRNKIHTFSVEEYVLPKYEVILEFPNNILKTMQTFPVKTCGRYTYGKPVQGSYMINLCQKATTFYSYLPLYEGSPGNCASFIGKLDHLGCATNIVRTDSFHLPHVTSMHYPTKLDGVVTITEEGTGTTLSTTAEANIFVSPTVYFVDPKPVYKPGMPYSISLEMTDSKYRPIPAQKIYVTYKVGNLTEKQTLMTNDDGHALLILQNTTNWTEMLTIKASAEIYGQPTPDFFIGNLGVMHIYIYPLYSPSNSYLNLKSSGKDQTCLSQQEVNVQYQIRHSQLKKDTTHLYLYYLITSKGRIHLSGSQKIEIKKPDTDLQGELSFTFSLDDSDSTSINVLAYIFLPTGELIADNLKMKTMRCFRNKVSVGFLPEEVVPGSDVSLQVQATPGSLCGLRVVDKSVVLMKPENELTADKVYDLFADSQFADPHSMDMPKDAELIPCANVPAGTYYANPYSFSLADEDIYRLLLDAEIKAITSAELRKPIDCNDPLGRGPGGKVHLPGGIGFGGIGVGAVEPIALPGVIGPAPGIATSGVGFGNEIPRPTEKVEPIRKYFPETWIWQLTPVGNSGMTELHHIAPDTLTDWMAGAMCMGPNGFGISPPVPLKVFQPFFVDLALPYSVIRGEAFTLKASVFNYLKQCIKVQTTLLPSLELEMEACPECQYSSCLCADESKTFQWNVKAVKLGEMNITVRTEAVNTPELCNNEVPLILKQGNTDTVKKPLIVKPGGLLVEKSHNSMICIQEGQDTAKTESISLKIPENILKDSERAYLTVVGDMMGTTLEHLDNLLTMPFGCGEQNMVRFAPNIFVLKYLEKTNQLNSEIKSRATNFMRKGYQGQLSYKRDDGSYSAYGKSDPEGNTWLTAFVLKTFSQSRPYISIDEVQLNAAYAWLTRNQYYTGCFQNVGKLFHTSMKGGIDDDISLSTYVTIALLESGKSPQDPLVRDSVVCLQQLALNVTNMYTQALLAYAFTLYGDTYYRKILLDRLEEKAVRKDGQLYWQPKPQPISDQQFWQQASSTEVELTSYILLAYLSAPTKNLVYTVEIVHWLTKQQNAFGGFSSTQDTVVALQALALYSEAMFIDKGDATVTVTSSKGFREEFHVNNDNRLLLQRTSLSDVPGEYTVTSSGNRCVYVQALLRYNIPPQQNDAAFMIRLEVKSIQCIKGLPARLQINFFVMYTGSRQKSNMALIEVKMLSGFFPLKSSIEQLKIYKVVQRAEQEYGTLSLYMDELGHTLTRFALLVEQDYPVTNLRPAAVKIYDYYERDEQATAEYNSPCI